MEAQGILEELFPPGAGVGNLRGEAEVGLSYKGRSVTLPAALLISREGKFRIDLLDPLDRPVAIIFSQGERIVQYRPRTRTAALLNLLPQACRTVLAGDWVSFVLGSGPVGGEREGFESVRWFGGDSLVKYEWGTLSVKIEYREKGEETFPSRVSWYCGDEVAVRLQYGEGKVGGEDPVRFRVEYPRAGLRIDVRLGRHETGMPLPEKVFHPPLPAGTRWQGWDLVVEDRGGAG